VLDPVLRTAAAGKGLRVADGAAVLCDLAERARREARLICGFGAREKEASLADFGVDLSDRYLNVHPVAKRRWKATRNERPVRRSEVTGHHPGGSMRQGGYSLDFFEKGLGLPRPLHLAPGLATRRLRAVRKPLAGHGDWSRVTRTARAKWQKLLDYNETDVRNTAALARWALGGNVGSSTDGCVDKALRLTLGC
jgi:hypothetical protein